MRRRAVLLGLTALLACGGTGLDPEGPEGTLSGQVTVGPNCPVEVEGVPCPPPPGIYESIQVHVYVRDGGIDRLVTTTRPDASGRFTLRLPPGTYRLALEHAIGIPGAPLEGRDVRIDPGATTIVEFQIDTGIR